MQLFVFIMYSEISVQCTLMFSQCNKIVKVLFDIQCIYIYPLLGLC